MLVKSMLLAAVLLVVVFLAYKKKALLLPALAGAVAFDISSLWFPAIKLFGGELGTVTLARILTVAIILSAGWSLLKEPATRARFRYLLSRPLTLSILLYIALGIFSLVYTIGRQKTGIECLRLISLFLLFIGMGLLAREQQAKQIMQVVHLVGLALVPLALYESVSLKFLWYQHLAEGEIARVNATFVDPNIFARYLVLSIVANLILQFLCKQKLHRLLYCLSLLAIVAALAVTLSRSGLLTLAVSLVVLIILLPRKQVALPVGLLGVAGAVLVFLRPTILARLLTFKKGLGALDAQRQYLWQGAWLMFKSHPLFGVGLGGFQKTFLTYYSALKTVPEGATLSHTTVLTIAAELGAVGLVLLANIWLQILRVLLRLRKGPIETYALGLGYFVWIGAIFISSQSEARFFEDPLIWLGMGMLLALAGGSKDEVKKLETAANPAK